MPEYKSRKSQSYKKSKNSKNSKSGGRRRKHTMRKYRRGKKVMRGGAISDALYDFMDKVYRSNSTLEQKFKNAYKTKYGIDFNPYGATKSQLQGLDTSLKEEMKLAGFDVDKENY